MRKTHKLSTMVDRCQSPLLFPSTSKMQSAGREWTPLLEFLFLLLFVDLEELRNVTGYEIGMAVFFCSLNGGGGIESILVKVDIPNNAFIFN